MNENNKCNMSDFRRHIFYVVSLHIDVYDCGVVITAVDAEGNCVTVLFRVESPVWILRQTEGRVAIRLVSQRESENQTSGH